MGFPQADCHSGRSAGGGARPFRPIPVYAEDFSKPGPEKIQVVVYEDETNADIANDPTVQYQVVSVETEFNHGDERFTQNGQRQLNLLLRIRFPGDDPDAPPPLRPAYDVRDLRRSQTGGLPDPNGNYLIVKTSDRLLQESFQAAQPPSNPVIAGSSITTRLEFVNGRVVETSADSQARGLFVPSKPLRRLMQSGDVSRRWPLNLSESQRAWNRGLSQRDEKELKEALATWRAQLVPATAATESHDPTDRTASGSIVSTTSAATAITAVGGGRLSRMRPRVATAMNVAARVAGAGNPSNPM